MNLRLTPDEIGMHTRAIIDDLRDIEGPLLPVLHAVQDMFGYVPDEAKPIIASELNLSRAEVHGVVSFYHDYRAHPSGDHVLKLCRAEACQAMGGDMVAAQLQAGLGIDWHGTTADGRLTLEPVFCLGLCACAPAAMLDGEVHGRVTAEGLKALIAEVGQ